MVRKLNLILLLALLSGPALGSGYEESKGIRQLKWPGRTIKIFISSSLYSSSGAIQAESDVNGALLRALQRWEEAANIEFMPSLSDLTAISPPGPAGDGVSLITIAGDPENVAEFNKKPRNASGLTRVFFDHRGFITEADIVLNPSQLFTTDKTPGTFDLEAVLTHEIGHLLGLSHSADASSVMFEGVPRNGFFKGSAVLRPLSADDRAKVLNKYGFADENESRRFTVRGRTNSRLNAAGRYLAWVQDARSGALVEVNVGTGKQFEFAGLRNGSYAVFLQDHSLQLPVSAATSSDAMTVYSDVNVEIPRSFKEVTFDIRYIGLNGQLGKRGLFVDAGDDYRLFLAGPGLTTPELRFAATSKGISLEPLTSDSPFFEENLPVRTFRMSIATSVGPGQYSIFAEDRAGSRRYLVGAVTVK